MANDSLKKSSTAAIALAWLIVVAPTAWGFSYTVQNAMKLFSAPPPAATAPAGAAAPTPAAAPAAAPAAR